jgi:hypothetical protein
VALECLVATVATEGPGDRYGMRAGLTPHERRSPVLVSRRLRVLAKARAADLPDGRLPDGLHQALVDQLAVLAARERKLAAKRQAKQLEKAVAT